MLNLGRPLSVAVLCSRRAPGLEELIERSRRGAFRIVCCLTSEEDFAERALAEENAIRWISHPVRAFHRARGVPLSNRAARARYDAETARLLAPFRPDVVVLSSYLYVLTAPMLRAFPERIFNVHGSDLEKTGPDGKPLYVGLRAIRDAIVAGEPETRASFHLVTEALDEGPALLRSWAFPVSPLVEDARRAQSRETLHAYAFAHQEWMLRRAWGRLLSDGIELMAGSPVRLVNGAFRIGPFRGPWDLSERGGVLLESEPPALGRAVGE
jgi:folate-dependent phosphoribosylglycinamide formyltransferase PurN